MTPDSAGGAPPAPATANVVVASGTIVVYSDIACPWATVAMHRIHGARRRLGLEHAVAFDHRAFPLEIANSQPTSMSSLEAEFAVMQSLTPDYGWQRWSQPASTWPVSTLLALESVEAAKQQSLEAGDQLDGALRRAFFVESRCITMRHVIVEAAASCEAVDADRLAEALDDGRARLAMLDGYRSAAGALEASPHFFLADGTDVANPGISVHWQPRQGDVAGHPVVDSDDPAVYDDILVRAAGGSAP